jgi:hypothetical protein
VYQGAVAPEPFTVRVKQGRTGFDLSAATSAQILVERPNGERVTWAPTTLTNLVPPSNGVRSSVDVTYVLGTVPNDTIEPGTYAFVVAVTLPAGVVRTPPRPLRVRSPFELEPC